jgi:hypothetical protein
LFWKLPNFGESFAKFALISLWKKGRAVSEGPRREKNSEKSQNTTHFRHPGYGYNHAFHCFGRNAQFPLENGDLGRLHYKRILYFSPASARLGA